jgi:rod shape-determining protein MreD
MATILAVPILLLMVILQSAVVSQVPLLHGTADMVLLVITAWALQERVRTAWQWSLMGGLMVGYFSVLPVGIPIAGYLITTGLALALRRRIWQIPFLAMLVVLLVGTPLIQLSTALFLIIGGTPLSWLEAINLIVLPSLLLNLLLALPVYVIIRDLADWVYPEEIEI